MPGADQGLSRTSEAVIRAIGWSGAGQGQVKDRSGKGQGQVKDRSRAGQGLVRDTSGTAKGLVRGKLGAGQEVKICHGQVRNCQGLTGTDGRDCKVRGKARERAKLKDDCSSVGDLPFFILVSD